MENADKSKVILQGPRRFLEPVSCCAEGRKFVPQGDVDISLEIQCFDPDENCVQIMECRKQHQLFPPEDKVELAGISNAAYVEESKLMVEDENLTDEVEKSKPNSAVNLSRVVFSKLLNNKKPRLSGGIWVQAHYVRGQALVDIRRWVGNKEGTVVATKKGVSLTLVRWVRLMAQEKKINCLLQDVKDGTVLDQRLHISGPVMISLCSPFWTLNLREYYKNMQSGEIMPTGRGVVINHFEWESLMLHANEIKEKMSEIVDTEPCYIGEDHYNQEGLLRCPECCPWTYQEYSD